MGAAISFEETTRQATRRLHWLRDAAQALAKAVAQAADLAHLPEASRLDDLRNRCRIYRRLQDEVHGELAALTEELSQVVEAEKTRFDQRGVAGWRDRAIGWVSAPALRRRLEKRSRRPVNLAPLRLVLGRLDRFSGVILPHRQELMAQRADVETAIAVFAEHHPVVAQAVDATTPQERRSHALAVASAAGVLGQAAHVLNEGVRDCNILLHKLTFDVEHLLHLYAVLVEVGAGASPEQELVPDSYPQFHRALRRFRYGYLPGRRVAAYKAHADAAFADRYQQVLERG
jgi:hypothetical protein